MICLNQLLRNFSHFKALFINRFTELFLLTQIAYPLDVYGLFQNFEFLSKLCRQLDIIEGLMFKIYDSFALDAFKMLVLLHAAVKTPYIARTFHYKSNTHIVQCQQRSVHRIERYAWKCLSYLFVQHLSRRMLVCVYQLLIYFYTLGSYPQAGFSA